MAVRDKNICQFSTNIDIELFTILWYTPK